MWLVLEIFVYCNFLLLLIFKKDAALLSSDACELAPLRIVLVCVFSTYFYFSFYTCNVCNDYV